MSILLARLALLTCEVVRLELEDVDWELGRSDSHMFEMLVIRAVGTYFSLSELAMMRHSGVMP